MPLPSTCPRCEAALEQGYVTGQMMYLNWTPEGESVGVLTFGKEHLVVGSPFRPPMLPTARCRSCGLGVFEAGREDNM